MAGKLSISPFINIKGEERFQVLGSKGNTFLNVRGYGFISKKSAYNGLVFFSNQLKNKKK